MTAMQILEKKSGLQKAARSGEFLPSPKWVRVFFGGEFIADSRHALLVYQGHVPTYYFPRQDVRSEFLQESEHSRTMEGLGKASYYTVKVGERSAKNAAWSIGEPQAGAEQLQGYIAFKWDQMDNWFEEGEEVFVHPRDPFVRIDVIRSSRHVKVLLGGELVAESRQPVLLFETGLPTRYYLPKTDLRLDLLEPSQTHTECPYKGEASYYSVRAGGRVYEDIAWYYSFPHPEVGKIQNLVAFYNEKVELIVDGEKV